MGVVSSAFQPIDFEKVFYSGNCFEAETLVSPEKEKKKKRW